MTASPSHAAHLGGPGDRERHNGRRGIERSRKSARLEIPRIDVDTASREKLIAHIDELEFILDDLLPKEEATDALAGAFGLSPQQALILAELASGRPVRKDRLCIVIGREDDAGLGWMNPISVRVHHLRKRVERFGIKINVVWGVGYQLDASSVDLVRSIIDGEG